MFYIYTISIGLSFVSLVLLLIRILINKKNLNLDDNKYNWKVLLSLLVVNILPVINIIFMISSAYISIFMKKDQFVKLINE